MIYTKAMRLGKNFGLLVFPVFRTFWTFGLRNWTKKIQGFRTLFLGKFSVTFAKFSGVRNPCIFSVQFRSPKVQKVRNTGKTESPKYRENRKSKIFSQTHGLNQQSPVEPFLYRLSVLQEALQVLTLFTILVILYYSL